jgi:hypothetical protein
MKFIITIAAIAALGLTSCQSQNTTVMVGGSGGGITPGLSSRGGIMRGAPPVGVVPSGGPVMRGGGTTTVTHYCAHARRDISIRNVPVHLGHINCKHCGVRVACGGGGLRGASYGSHPAGHAPSYYGTPYPAGRYHDAAMHDAWARQQGAFGYSPQRYPHAPRPVQYADREGMVWNGVSGSIVLPRSMTGR